MQRLIIPSAPSIEYYQFAAKVQVFSDMWSLCIIARGRRAKLSADQLHEATSLAMWIEIHEAMQTLDDDARDVLDLLWYQGLKQSEAAKLLGVSERTLKRRWQQAQLATHDRRGRTIKGSA